MTLKVIICGAKGVGKTQLARGIASYSRLNQYTFQSGYEQTMSTEFINVPAKYNLWALSGKKSFQLTSRAYYRSADVACLCFDVNNRSSFERVKHDLTILKLFAPARCLYILVATRMDLGPNSQTLPVSQEEIEAFSKNENIPFVSSSAKTGAGIEQLVGFLEDKLKHQEPQKPSAKPVNIKPLRNTSPSNHSFRLDALTALATVGGLALGVAALVTFLVVGSIPLSASLLAGGVVLGVLAAGTFFCRRSTMQDSTEKIREQISPQSSLN